MPSSQTVDNVAGIVDPHNIEDPVNLMNMQIGEDTAPRPKDDEAPPSGKPEAKADDKAKEPDGKPGWDADRQKRDEERAERQRKLEDRVDTIGQQMQALPSQILDTLKGIIQSPQKPGETAGEKVEDDLEAMIAALEGAGENVEAEQILKTLRGTAKAVKGRDGELAKLQENFDNLVKTVQEDRARSQKRDELDAARDSQAALRSQLDNLDRQYGNGTEILRADAVAMARQTCRELGFDEDGLDTDKRPLPASTAVVALREAYRAVAAKKAEQERQTTSSTPNLDNILGGKAADGEIPRGTMKEVVSAMKRTGQIQ